MNASSAGTATAYPYHVEPRHSQASRVCWYLMLLCIPFLQLGLSFHFSVQLLAMLLLMTQVSWKASSLDLALLFSSLPLFFLKFIYFSGSDTTHAVFSTANEFLSYSLLFFSFKGIFVDSRNKALILAAIRLFFWLSVIFLLVQTAFITRGIYVSFPFSWFVENQGTLLVSDAALTHNTYFRPSAFYGEPSYMASVLSVLLFAYTKLETRKARNIEAIALCFLCIALLQSVFGIAAFLAVLGLRSSRTMRLIAVIALFAGGILFVTFEDTFASDNPFISRISLITQGGHDESTSGRLAVPFQVLKNVFAEGKYFGITKDELFEKGLLSQVNSDKTTVDNALLAMMLWYGIFSLPILLILFYRLNNLALIGLVLVLMNANGAFLSYDKAFLLSMCLGLSNAALRTRNQAVSSRYYSTANFAQ